MREKPRDKERLEHILNSISTIKSKPSDYWEAAIATDPVAYYGLCKLIEMNSTYPAGKVPFVL